MLAVEEQFRWMQAGFKDRQPITYPKAGYLEAVKPEIDSAREQVAEYAQGVAQKQLLLAQSGQLKLLGPGGEDDNEKVLADHDIMRNLVRAEVHRFERISAKIEEIGERRDDVSKKRLERLTIEYRPGQRKFYPRFIVCYGTKEHRIWTAFKFEKGFTICRQDDSISEQEMQKLTDEKEARKWIRKGYNVLFLDFREGLDFHEQLEEALNRHSENLQRQEAKKKGLRVLEGSGDSGTAEFRQEIANILGLPLKSVPEALADRLLALQPLNRITVYRTVRRFHLGDFEAEQYHNILVAIEQRRGIRFVRAQTPPPDEAVQSLFRDLLVPGLSSSARMKLLVQRIRVLNRVQRIAFIHYAVLFLDLPAMRLLVDDLVKASIRPGVVARERLFDLFLDDEEGAWMAVVLQALRGLSVDAHADLALQIRGKTRRVKLMTIIRDLIGHTFMSETIQTRVEQVGWSDDPEEYAVRSRLYETLANLLLRSPYAVPSSPTVPILANTLNAMSNIADQMNGHILMKQGQLDPDSQASLFKWEPEVIDKVLMVRTLLEDSFNREPGVLPVRLLAHNMLIQLQEAYIHYLLIRHPEEVETQNDYLNRQRRAYQDLVASQRKSVGYPFGTEVTSKDPFRGPGGDSALGEPADKLSQAKRLFAEKQFGEAVFLLEEAAASVDQVLEGLLDDSELLPAARALQTEITILLVGASSLKPKSAAALRLEDVQPLTEKEYELLAPPTFNVGLLNAVGRRALENELPTIMGRMEQLLQDLDILRAVEDDLRDRQRLDDEAMNRLREIERNVVENTLVKTLSGDFKDACRKSPGWFDLFLYHIEGGIASNLNGLAHEITHAPGKNILTIAYLLETIISDAKRAIRRASKGLPIAPEITRDAAPGATLIDPLPRPDLPPIKTNLRNTPLSPQPHPRT